MSKVKFNLKLSGVNQLMRSPEMQGILTQYGQAVSSGAQSMCPKGEYNVRTYPIKWIAVCNISAENYEAVKDGYEHNTLLKALGGGA